MPFTSAITYKTVFGDLRCHIGTYDSSGGSTGGDVVTGLSQVFFFKPTSYAAATIAQPVVNETRGSATNPIIGGLGLPTVVSAANDVGMWIAVGR